MLSILLAVIVVPSSISGTAIALESIAQSFSDIALYANTLTQSTLAKNLIQDEKWEELIEWMGKANLLHKFM